MAGRATIGIRPDLRILTMEDELPENGLKTQSGAYVTIRARGAACEVIRAAARQQGCTKAASVGFKSTWMVKKAFFPRPI
jgi:hypothetical protein